MSLRSILIFALHSFCIGHKVNYKINSFFMHENYDFVLKSQSHEPGENCTVQYKCDALSQKQSEFSPKTQPVTYATEYVWLLCRT